MKKITFAITFILLGFISEAQIKYGPKAGLNIASLIGKDADEYDIKTLLGLHLGGFLNIPVSNNYSLQPEIMFSTASGSGEYATIKASIYFDYISLPVLVQYNFKSGIFAELGPQADFMLTANATALGVLKDVRDQFKSTSFSAVAGVGYKHTSGFGGSVRYGLGLSKITEDGTDIKTGIFSISLLYGFKSKIKK